MAARAKHRPAWWSVVLIVVAVALWLHEELPDTAPAKAATEKTAGAYEHFTGCTLVPDRRNDGDSFLVRLPDGREETFRLYYVDAPESAFKQYSGGRNNHERIREQAADLGKITPQRAVEVGARAKTYVLGLLEPGPFEIDTKWDSPFRDGRFHAFVTVRESSGPRQLHRLLIERGLARIKTKPAPLPDGTSVGEELDTLRDLQRAARQQRRGAWEF